jgi:hypothetical protein
MPVKLRRSGSALGGTGDIGVAGGVFPVWITGRHAVI